jgi:hypothetical protein
VRLRGAFWRVTLVAVAMGQASSAFAGPPSCRPAGCAGGAAQARRARQHGGKARRQRAAAQPGAVGDAPPRRLAHARRLAAHRPDHGSCAEPSGMAGRWQRVERASAPRAPGGRTPSLRWRQIDSVLGSDDGIEAVDPRRTTFRARAGHLSTESGVNQRRRPWARPYPDQVVLRAVGLATGSTSGGRPTSGANAVVEPLHCRRKDPADGCSPGSVVAGYSERI